MDGDGIWDGGLVVEGKGGDRKGARKISEVTIGGKLGVI